jgi:anti-sigma factor RsiW
MSVYLATCRATCSRRVNAWRRDMDFVHARSDTYKPRAIYSANVLKTVGIPVQRDRRVPCPSCRALQQAALLT